VSTNRPYVGTTGQPIPRSAYRLAQIVVTWTPGPAQLRAYHRPKIFAVHAGRTAICLWGPEEKRQRAPRLRSRCGRPSRPPLPRLDGALVPGCHGSGLRKVEDAVEHPRGMLSLPAATPRACPDPGQRGHTRMGYQAGCPDRRIAPSRGARCVRSWLPIMPRPSYAVGQKGAAGGRVNVQEVRALVGARVTVCYLGDDSVVDRVVDREPRALRAPGAFRGRCAAIGAGGEPGAKSRASRNA
jgi:hypothetical protein